MQTSVTAILGPRRKPRERVFFPEYGFNLEVIDTRKQDIEYAEDIGEDTLAMFANRSETKFLDDSDGLFFTAALPRQSEQLRQINKNLLVEAAVVYITQHLKEDEPSGFELLNLLAWECIPDHTLSPATMSELAAAEGKLLS